MAEDNTNTMSSETVVEILYDDQFYDQLEREPANEPIANVLIRVDGYGIFGESCLGDAQDEAVGFFLETISDLLDLYNEPDRTCRRFHDGTMICLHPKKGHLTVELRDNDDGKRGLFAASTIPTDDFAIATVQGADQFLEKTATLGATELLRRDELVDAVAELRIYLIEERGISESDI